MKARVLIIATLDLPTSASSNLLLRLWRAPNYDSVAIVNERYTKALVELFLEALSRRGESPLGNKAIENNEVIGFRAGEDDTNSTGERVIN